MSTPLITNIIPQQGFEIVRNLIGSVLKTELENQKLLASTTPNPIDFPLNIYVGRSTPFNQSEQVMINVSLDSVTAQNNSEASQHNETSFFIHVYVRSKETTDKKGGENATLLRDRFVGLIRYILQDTHYKELGLPFGNGVIMGTYLNGFENYEPENKQDGSFIKMSTINYMVRINESQSLWEGILASELFTKLTLGNTDQGFQNINELN